jgi:putative ABC transport system permease protein
MGPIDEELQFHIEMQTRRYIEAGLDPVAARAKALQRMGDLNAAAKAVQELSALNQEPPPNRAGWMNGLGQDIRHAIRLLRRSPGYVAITIVMLATGTGASTAVFSVVDGVILRTPFDDVKAIAYLRAQMPDGRLTNAVPRDAYLRLESGLPGPIAAVGSYTISSPTVTGVDTPRRTQVECLSASMAGVLGTQPMMGRWFTAAEDYPGGPGVALVSAKFWRGTLARDPNVLGRTIMLDNEPATIIGVMPRGFDGPLSRFERDIWVPYGQTTAAVQRFGCRPPGATVNAMARLRPGVTIDAGSAALREAGLALAPLTEGTTAELQNPFFALVGAVVAILLIAFANVANIGLERLVGRRRELGIRLALGATRARLIRETVVEHILVAAAGAAAGIGVAYLSFDAILALLPPSLPNLDTVAINARVLTMSVGLAMLGGLASGLVAAVQASGTAVRAGVTGGDRGHTRGSFATRRILVVTELALGVLLLVGALLMVRTFVTLRPSAPGFDPTNKQVALVRLPPETPDADERRFFEGVRTELASTPGVRAIAGTSYLPMYGSAALISLAVGDLKGEVFTATTSTNYFDVMRIPVLRGRSFTDQDGPGAPAVAVVNEAFVRRWLPSREPLGASLTLDGGGIEARPLTIVGVVGDTRFTGTDTRARPEVHLPFAQEMMGNPFFVVDTDASAAASFPTTIQGMVSRRQPGQLVDRVESLDTILGTKVAQPRLGAWLFGGFAALAVLLSAVGLGATLAWSVAQRRREIGIRMALGARAGDVRRLIVGQMLAMSVTGVLLGLLAAAASTKLLAGWLYGVTSRDTLTFVACGALMLAVSALAAYLPARRATRISPLIALRGD